ncbi:anthranilate synthase component I family protein [Taibaiella sp. KBW10]|uniref:anthranilate synthase component I family protein n=1 Tax=Taibaiella sp. KBW10 TaxID=2153357 RepID=UPI000F5996E9|nr:anthranilate synthase component I family protein [Taibaiella sp. KBW10]
MLNWIKQFSIFSYLDNNNYTNLYNRYELLIAADAYEDLKITTLSVLSEQVGQGWLFGHFNYDLKNTLYPSLQSAHPAYFKNEPVQFFRPKVVAYIPYGTSRLVIESEGTMPELIWQQMMLEAAIIGSESFPEIKFTRNCSPAQYLSLVEQVKVQLREGNCYELNLCVGAYATAVAIDPVSVFDALNRHNPAPFACLYRQAQHWLMSSSPERFLYKESEVIIAQPMKGTIRRGSDEAEDEAQKIKLLEDQKERAENVMITDLMRNDLAKSCRAGSITVPELFGVYTFPSLHTMVSTVKGILKDKTKPLEALLAAFPMGSMTGAPKHIVMQIIESLEQSKRELYSGAVGYFSPDGDFDFNVVIRSLLYHEQEKMLSYHTGGAITIDSVPEQEWEEVLLKSKALENLFL